MVERSTPGPMSRRLWAGMADLFDEQLALLGADSIMHDLAERVAVPLAVVREAAVLGAPVVLVAITDWMQGAFGSAWVTTRLAGDDISDPGRGSRGLDDTGDGDAVLDFALGDDREAIVGRVGSRAGLEPPVIDQLMRVAAAAVLVALARRYAAQPSRAALVATMTETTDALLESGWSAWIEEATAGRPHARPGSGGATPRPAYPPPVVGIERQRSAVANASVTVASPVSEVRHPRTASDPTIGPVAGDTSARATDDPAERIDRRPPPGRLHAGTAAPSESRPRPWAVVALVALLLIGTVSLLALALNAGDNASETDAGAPSSTEQPGTTTELADGIGGGDIAESGSSNGDPDADPPPDVGGDTDADHVEVVVSLADPLEQTDATGTATLEFDPAGGEICFDLRVEGLAAPYDGHIHVGPVGIKGGIVVDVGGLSGNPTDCVEVRPNDIASILDDLAGHYVELHDADGATTIRSQLADADPRSPQVTAADEEGGAYAVLGAGSLRLEGDVPDRVTVDKYLESFADIDLGETELVDELRIVPGSPRPSGRIVVDDEILFDVGSARIASPDSTILRDLATIFNARPAWSLTVVGHTDATGPDVYNLELSLQRAAAVRDALVRQGVAAESMTITGAGSTEPIASNDTSEGRSLNRRIEFVITPG